MNVNTNNQRTAASPSLSSARAGGGFTIIELLVVMFVIAMLLTIGVPAALRYRTMAKIHASQVTVNIIDKAVDMYHEQHKHYPEMEDMVAKLIGQSFLFKPNQNVPEEVDDGHPGPGYRLQPRGPVYGPWNGVDKLARNGDYEQDQGGGQNEQARIHFLDAFGARIWYCPFKESTYTDDKFEPDNSEPGVTIVSIADYATEDNTSHRLYRRDFIVMSPSANGKWGLIRNISNDTGSSSSSSTDVRPLPTDDVTNFTK